jgi:hypothetical protein
MGFTWTPLVFLLYFIYLSLGAANFICMDPVSILFYCMCCRYLKDVDDDLSLGPGPFVTGLEYATGRTAKVLAALSRLLLGTWTVLATEL